MKTFIDGLHQESVKIYNAKLDALARGDEAVSKQVGEGKDVMSILSKHFLHSQFDRTDF